jgi:predicted nucleic acid-binding Zn ribbon protein
MKDENLKKCPECGEETLKRLIGAGAGLIFKGSGFYLTDYKNSPQKSESSKSTAAEKTTEKTSTSEKSSDSSSKSEVKSSAASPEKSD